MKSSIRTIFTGFAAAAAAMVLLSGAAARAAVPLASHRVVYDLSLGKVRNNATIATASGRMALEFQDVCDGYIYLQRVRTRILYAEGEQLVTDYSLSSWDSRDGSQFRFSLNQAANGNELERFEGTATTGPDGGKVVYKIPEGKELDLPAGVIFPVTHTKRILEQARKGNRLLTVYIFDGGGEDALSTATAFIKPTDSRDAPEGMENMAAWRIRMGFFDIEGRDSLPSFEVSFRLFDNGVADRLEMDYGDFTLKGKIIYFKLLDEPEC